MTLAWALQQCTILLKAPPGILCSAVQDLHRCLTLLIERDDLFDASMLEVAEEEPATFLNPAEGAGLLGEKPEPQEEWATALHNPDHPEEASNPEGAIRLGVMAITQRWLPLTPPGFSEPLAIKSGPPPLEDADSPVGVSWGLSSLGSMRIVIIHDTLTGKLQYHYETRVISQTSLHLTPPDYPDQPNTHWELKEP